MTEIIVVDLETAAIGEPPPAPEEYLARVGSATKPETIERKRAENLASWPDAWRKQSALDWRLGQIICLGVAVNGVVTVSSQMTEAKLLAAWWGNLDDYSDFQVAGFGIRSFDLPWLYGRSAVHGIQPSRILSENRYHHHKVVDWQDVLSSYGGMSLTGWTLGAYADLFQLEHRPNGTGVDVGAWAQARDWANIVTHCEADLRTTWDLDRRCRPVFLGGTA